MRPKVGQGSDRVSGPAGRNGGAPADGCSACPAAAAGPGAASDAQFASLPERQPGGAVGAGLRRRGAGHRRRALGAGGTAQRQPPAPLPAPTRRPHQGGAGRTRRAAGRRPRGAGGVGPRRLRALLLWRRRRAAAVLPQGRRCAGAVRARWTVCRTAARPFQLAVHDSPWPPADGARPRRGRHGGGVAGRAERGRRGTGRRLPGHPGCPADSGLAARQGPGADLGQPRLPERRGRQRSGNCAPRPGWRWTRPSATWPPPPAARTRCRNPSASRWWAASAAP